MNREALKNLAQETVAISRAGRYQAANQVVMFDAARPAELWTAEELERLVKETEIPGQAPAAALEVRGEGTVEALFRLSRGELLCPRLGVLNFASAKNPGGGFLNGSLAQEECLAFCSNLYHTQTTGQGPRYYEINRACPDPVYTDTMLIGDVTFFRTENLILTKDCVTCPVITAPAVNMGVVLRSGGSADRAREVMKGRMRKILALFAYWGCADLILGAYGCGVFRNDPEDVARFWQELLEGENWSRLFHSVTFSILERPGKEGNIGPFHRRFGTAPRA